MHLVTTALDTICCCRLSPHVVSTNCLKLDFCNFGVRADIVTRKSAILQVFLISQSLNPAQAVKLPLSIKLRIIHPAGLAGCISGNHSSELVKGPLLLKFFSVPLAIKCLDLVTFDAAVFQTFRYFHNTCRNLGF